MSSLYKRASAPQARILRAVEGAVKNAADAHPEIQISPRHRRSIAKRAAGTLTAQWPDVLAATKPSSKARSQLVEAARESQITVARRRRAVRLRDGRSPLGLLKKQIAKAFWPLKAEPNEDRRQALIDVMRMISKIERRLIDLGREYHRSLEGDER